MSRYFGTDGFRGKANVALTAEHAYEVGRFLGWYYGRTHRARIVVGKDTRRSGYMLEDAISAGLTASGADVYLLHVTTTPSVSYVTRTDGFDCGVMISASHNAFCDNGIKLVGSDGEKMDDETIRLVEDYLDGKLATDSCPVAELPLATDDRIGTVIDYSAGRNRYIAHLISLISHSFNGMKIGLDCANGSAWSIAPGVFRALGADVSVINDQPDGMNINDKAGSTHIETLRHFVTEHHLDVGFAFDGDADRCIAVDETGGVTDGDRILYICARHLKEHDRLINNTIVTTVMSNLGLYKALDDAGIGYVKTAVGDKYVYEHMTAHGNLLGGEQNGHIIFAEHARSGDGILTALKLMEVMLDTQCPLSSLAAPMTVYPQVMLNIRVTDQAAVMADAQVQSAIRAAEEQLANTGRILVRKSGTEPLIRVMVEAADENTCRKLAQDVVDVIQQKGYAVLN